MFLSENEPQVPQTAQVPQTVRTGRVIAIASQMPLLGFAGLMLAAAISDIRALRIPNLISLAAVLLYPVHILWTPTPIDWAGALAIATAALAVGFVLFNFRIVGGGDAKLFAAAALWAGPELVIPLVLSTGIAGGVLAAFLWLMHHLPLLGIPVALPSTAAAADFGKQPLPYGVAIAPGAAFVTFNLTGAV